MLGTYNHLKMFVGNILTSIPFSAFKVETFLNNPLFKVVMNTQLLPYFRIAVTALTMLSPSALNASSDDHKESITDRMVVNGKRIQNDTLYVEGNQTHYDIQLPHDRQMVYFPDSRELWLKVDMGSKWSSKCSNGSKGWLDIIDNNLDGNVDRIYRACRHYWDGVISDEIKETTSKQAGQALFDQALEEVTKQ